MCRDRKCQEIVLLEADFNIQLFAEIEVLCQANKFEVYSSSMHNSRTGAKYCTGVEFLLKNLQIAKQTLYQFIWCTIWPGRDLVDISLFLTGVKASYASSRLRFKVPSS
jgi:hypothetical protein